MIRPDTVKTRILPIDTIRVLGDRKYEKVKKITYKEGGLRIEIGFLLIINNRIHNKYK